MDEVTQQNSAMVEENAATARTLEQQAADHERTDRGLCGWSRRQSRRVLRRASKLSTAAKDRRRVESTDAALQTPLRGDRVLICPFGIKTADCSGSLSAWLAVPGYLARS